MTAKASAAGFMRGSFLTAWLVLIGATLVSWSVGTDHGIDNHTAITTLVVLVAFIKMRLIGLYFMELRYAPLALRAVFEAYSLMVCVLILTFYYAT